MISLTMTMADRGQGLNHCIADAMNFVDALKSTHAAKLVQTRLRERIFNTTFSFLSVPLKEAIDKYDAEVVKRGSDEVETSVKSAIFLHQTAMEAPVLTQGYAKR